MKVKVLIEYEIPAIDVLSDDDVRVIEAELLHKAPFEFESDGCVMCASSWTIEFLK